MPLWDDVRKKRDSSGRPEHLETYAKPRLLIHPWVLLPDFTKISRHASSIRGNGFSDR